MSTYNIKLTLTRCIFSNNDAVKGDNIFIRYKELSQRVSRESFGGCTAVASTSHDQDNSFCFSLANDQTVFIDEREILHNSWKRQQSQDVVRFISNPDDAHPFSSIIPCGHVDYPCEKFDSIIKFLEKEQALEVGTQALKIESIFYGKGKYEQPAVALLQTHSTSVDIAGC
ncbi:MAG: hypothetical protein EZS28_040553, partial [Streblomastix strix]